MRLIDADALLSRLKQPTVEDINEVLRVEYDNAPNDVLAAEAVYNMYESVREAIDDAPTIAPRDWTPCAEGLPDTNDDVYITYEYRGKLIAAIGFMGHSGAWYILEDDDGNEAKVNAIAWQPLPDPYNPDHIVDANKKVED